MSEFGHWATQSFSMGTKSDAELDLERKQVVSIALKRVSEADPSLVYFGTYQNGEFLQVGGLILFMSQLEIFFPVEREQFEPILVLARAWLVKNPKYTNVAVASLF